MKYEKLEKLLITVEKKSPFKNDDDMKAAVEKILKKEQKKKGVYQDNELIEQCIDTILMLNGYDVDKINKNNELLIERGLCLINKKKSQKSIDSRKRTILYNEKLLFVLGIMLVLLITQLTAMAFGYNPVIEIYEFFTSNGVLQKVNETGITYTYHDDTKTYTSINELIEKENLDIQYPTILPDGIEVQQIRKYIVDDYNEYFIVFNTDILLWQIDEKYSINIDYIEFYETLNINNSNVYIIDQQDNYMAIFYHDNYEYSVTYNDYDTLIEIIKNIKVGENNEKHN